GHRLAARRDARPAAGGARAGPAARGRATPTAHGAEAARPPARDGRRGVVGLEPVPGPGRPAVRGPALAAAAVRLRRHGLAEAARGRNAAAVVEGAARRFAVPLAVRGVRRGPAAL